MYRKITRTLPVLAALLLGLALQTATAHEFSKGDLTITHPYAFPSIGAARAGAVFLGIRNGGDSADALVAVEFAGAARSELHTHIHQDGTMRMRPVEQIIIPAGGEALLQPGGDHIMLMGLTAGLELESVHDLVLVFREAGRVEVQVHVEARK